MPDDGMKEVKVPLEKRLASQGYRTEILHVRLSKHQKDYLAQLAQDTGTTMSDIFRSVVQYVIEEDIAERVPKDPTVLSDMIGTGGRTRLQKWETDPHSKWALSEEELAEKKRKLDEAKKTQGKIDE